MHELILRSLEKVRILLLNASAKNYGATQEILFTIKKQVRSIDTFDNICLGDVNLKFCKGCKLCYDTCKCNQEDDMETIINKIDSSDIIIVAAPSYWADIPGQFKVFIDRCTIYSDTNPNPSHRELKSGKKCFAIALRTGIRPMECEHIIETIHHWCGHMKINLVDSMYFCGIKDKQDVTRYKDIIRKKTIEWLY